MEIVFLEPLGVCDDKMKNLQDNFEKKGHTFRYFSNRTENESMPTKTKSTITHQSNSTHNR